MDTGRRRILQGLTGVGAGLVIGCGSGGVDNFGGNFGGATLSDSPGGPSSAPIGGDSVSGRVNLAELGGTNVSMGSVLQAQAGISGAGNFQLNVSPDRPLLVFATDDSKVVRGLAVSIPGRPLLVDAQSTALALIFMTAGLSSSDPAETGLRLDSWAVHPGFAALVSALRSLLPAAGLAGAVKDAGVQAALAAIILSVTPKMFLAKDQPFTYEEMLLKQPAGLQNIYNSEQPAISISFGLQNLGFRFVSVVRQRRTVRGDIVDTIKPDLVGSPFVASAKNTVNGVNSFSLGNLFTGQAFTAGDAQDLVVLNDSALPLTKAIYWYQGLGTIVASDHVAPPQEVADLFDTSIPDFFTLVYYILMPLLEPFAAVGQAAKAGVLDFRSADMLRKFADLYDNTTKTNTVLASQAAINTGGLQNTASALIDATLTLLTPLLVETLGTLMAAALGVEVAVVTVPLSLAIAAALAGMSAANALLAAQYYSGKKIPRVTAVEMPLPTEGILDFMAPRESVLKVQGISALGTALYSTPTGTLALKEFTKAAQQVVSASTGRITNLDGVFYLRDSDNNPVELGQSILPLPPDFESWREDLGVSSDSKQVGGLYLGGGSRAWVHNKDVGMTASTVYQDYALSTVAMGKTRLFTVGVRGSGASGHHARLSFDPGSGAWQEIVKENTQAVGYGLAGVVEEKYIQANKYDEALGLRVYWSGDLFDGIRTNFQSFLDTPYGAVPIQEVDTPFGQAEHGVSGLNDAGDVLGYLKYPDQPMANGFLWQRGPGGARINGVLIQSRLPAGAPVGYYLPAALGDSYAVLEYYATPNDLTGYYVWFMGKTRQELYPDPPA